MSNDNNPTLFEYEEYSQAVQAENTPVVCLGMEFANDAARREYFREELRKKLPELKKIEGFPIGEDDDIINLSDPPYYTACPNPWLNDFIAEWEKEKAVLESQGKRKKDFEVKEPYAYGIMQGKNSAIYNAHTYHTKVPYEVIMRYILHYTQPGDIVLDGFAGTGMTGVAASACASPLSEVRSEISADFKSNGYKDPQWGMRRAICGDLSPLCFHISSNYNSKVNVEHLEKCVNEIVDKLLKQFGHFYTHKVKVGNKEIDAHINYFVWSEIVACKFCGYELNVHDLSFNYETNEYKEKLICPQCGTVQKRVEANSIHETIFDEHLNNATSQILYRCCLLNYEIPQKGRFFSRDVVEPEMHKFVGYIPSYSIPTIGDEIPRLHKVGCKFINQLYHKRTQYVLGYLYNLIEESDPKLKKPLMFIFTSMLPKLTRMNRYMPQHGSRALVGPMANTLYIPPQGVENNPIDQFEYQAKKVIKAFRQTNEGNAIQICSATNNSIADSSVDYIFTDPPFGANIMYSELNTVSESWLKVMTNNREEAISNKSQNKGLFEYQSIMERCFEEYYRVLKHGHWMTVEFSNTSASFWNCLQYAIKNAGFIITTITDLNKERGGLHAMLGPMAVKQDLAISCYKPSKKMLKRVIDSDGLSAHSFVEEHLNRVPPYLIKEDKVVGIPERDPRILYDRLISYYVQHGWPIPMDAQEFQKMLQNSFIERDGMFFTASQALEYESKRKQTTGVVSMGLLIGSESDGIAWLNHKLEETPKTYQDLQPDWIKDLVAAKKGDVIPELLAILEENFIKDKDGHWRKPDPEKAADLEAQRNKRMAKEFATYLEFASKPKAKRMKDCRLEVLRFGFKECYKQKDFKSIVLIGDHIQESLLQEDEVLLQYYDIALERV